MNRRRPGCRFKWIVGCVLALCASIAAAAATAEVPTVVRAGAITDLPPFSQLDSSGRPIGFAVELFEAVARIEGFRVEWRPGESDALWQQLVQGQLDAIPAAARRREREGLADFTSNHTLGHEAFFVRGGGRIFDSVEDARGRSIIVTRGGPASDALTRRGFSPELVPVESLPAGLKLLAEGRHDAMLAPLRRGRSLVEDLGLAGAVEAGPPLAELRVEFAIAVRRGETALHDRIERGLAEVKASGEYDRLYARWLQPHDSPTLALHDAIGAVAIALAAIALLALWVWSLRRQVRLRQRAEAKLASERNLLRQVIDADPNLIQVKDAEGRYTLANLKGAALYGVSPRGIVGKTDAELLLGTGRSLDARIVEQAQAGQVALEFDDTDEHDPALTLEVGDIMLVDAAGRERWFSAARMPLQSADAAHASVLLVATDITARRQYEEDLQASEAKFKALVEQSLAGIFIQQQGKLIYANDRLAQMLGYDSPSDIVDQLALVELIAPEERARIAALVESARRGDVDEARVEVSALRRDGSTIRLEVHGNALEIDGHVAGIGLAIDITERERAALVREQALASFEELARLKTEFMSNMSHEMRTPLNGIIGMATIGLRTSDPAKAQHAFGRILEAGTKLERLVTDVLDFSTVGTTRFAVAPVPVELAAACAPALAEAREFARAKGLLLREELAPDLPRFVVADPNRLRQILGHLLANAVKFTERGEVVVRVSRDGAWLQCEVTDTGIGIAPDYLSRLFQPFEQADGSRTRRYGGTGLGLALTHLIVRRLGGTIAIDSELNRGTRVRVRLPLVEANPADVAVAATPMAAAADTG